MLNTVTLFLLIVVNLLGFSQSTWIVAHDFGISCTEACSRLGSDNHCDQNLLSTIYTADDFQIVAKEAEISCTQIKFGAPAYGANPQYLDGVCYIGHGFGECDFVPLLREQRLCPCRHSSSDGVLNNDVTVLIEQPIETTVVPSSSVNVEIPLPSNEPVVIAAPPAVGSLQTNSDGQSSSSLVSSRTNNTLLVIIVSVVLSVLICISAVIYSLRCKKQKVEGKNLDSWVSSPLDRVEKDLPSSSSNNFSHQTSSSSKSPFTSELPIVIPDDEQIHVAYDNSNFGSSSSKSYLSNYTTNSSSSVVSSYSKYSNNNSPVVSRQVSPINEPSYNNSNSSKTPFYSSRDISRQSSVTGHHLHQQQQQQLMYPDTTVPGLNSRSLYTGGSRSSSSGSGSSSSGSRQVDAGPPVDMLSYMTPVKRSVSPLPPLSSSMPPPVGPPSSAPHSSMIRPPTDKNQTTTTPSAQPSIIRHMHPHRRQVVTFTSQ